MDDLPSYFSWPFLVILFLLSLLKIFQHTQHTKKISSTKLPPGPSPLPIIGNLHNIGSSPHRSLHQLSRKYGDIVYLQLGRVPMVVVSSADLAEKVMKTYDLDFCSRPQTVAFRKLTYNFLDVAFSPYGDNWREMRKIMTIELLSNKRVQLTRGIREEEVARLVHEIAEAASADPNTSVDLSDMVIALAQNITCRLVLGKSWSFKETGARSKLLEPLDEAQALMGGIFMADYFPWAWWVDVVRGWNQRLETCFHDLDAYYDEAIDEHQLQRAKMPEQEDFMDELLRLEKSLGFTRDHSKAVLMNIFLAGVDTHSTTVVWAMCELLKNPSVMKRAQQEVRRVAGSKGKVEDNDLKELPYLNAVVKETFRVHPPVPLLVPRETMQKCTINGYEIAAKTQVMVNVFSIGLDPRYWKNPLEFLPDRFLNSSIDIKGQNFELLPFGAGRRSCPGIQMGMTIVELTLANLLYSFDWNLPVGMKKEDIDMSEGHGLSVCKRTPLIAVPRLA